ncbi:MAG: 2-succinyl-6-hydroxy-2,4-cyclohexadiene-1-carboxylate synthase [Kiritimatiellae bacterium]|nr:2-succinyl-6-hydroxy-2,4-cyclohexadiene-1-carboxylate synthase [Kiritimatiellia bacterium]
MSRLLNTTVHGSKECLPIVLLHGFMGASWEWNEVINQVFNDFFCITIDLPGHGKSIADKDADDYSLAGATEAVCHTLDSFNIKKSVLCGYSMGGRLALYLASHRPERWQGIIAESASPGIKNFDQRQKRAEHDKAIAHQLIHQPFEDFLQTWYNQPLFDSFKKNLTVYQTTLVSRRKNDPQELAKALYGMSIGHQKPLWQDLAKSRIPILSIAGEHDPKHRTITEEMGSLSKTIQTAIVSGAGHNVHVEKPHDYVHVIRDFIKGIYDNDSME